MDDDERFGETVDPYLDTEPADVGPLLPAPSAELVRLVVNGGAGASLSDPSWVELAGRTP